MPAAELPYVACNFVKQCYTPQKIGHSELEHKCSVCAICNDWLPFSHYSVSLHTVGYTFNEEYLPGHKLLCSWLNGNVGEQHIALLDSIDQII